MSARIPIDAALAPAHPAGGGSNGSAPPNAERMDVVIVGHVDHGKSTVIGRLMADTGSLPEGKLEQVRAMCARNSRPFEYAFLLDALKSEQAQGITIDTARCFFKTARRHYVIHDAPGHAEFLKNMVTGAARAEAALLVIDAKEGVRENSLRHGYILAMLGIRQVAVLVNKMDLVRWSEALFRSIVQEYSRFLEGIGLGGAAFVPVSAREGANIVVRAPEAQWFRGRTVLEQVDAFERGAVHTDEPFRMPVQDVYKFTDRGDDRRIVVGTVESGSLRAGDEIVFAPSGKRSRVATLERFAGDPPEVWLPDDAAGITLTEQVYITPGEMAYKVDEPEPAKARRFRATMLWLGVAPMVVGRKYALKIGSAKVPVELIEIERALDVCDLESASSKDQLDRHDVGQVLLETAKPVAMDLAAELERTGRFVVVDGYDIAACGVVLETVASEGTLLESRVRTREALWSGSEIPSDERAERYGHFGKLVIVMGEDRSAAAGVARAVERLLFERGVTVCYLGLDVDGTSGADPDTASGPVERAEHLEHLGAIGRAIADSGVVLVTAVGPLDSFELGDVRTMCSPRELVAVHTGGGEPPAGAVLRISPGTGAEQAADIVARFLAADGVIPEYEI